MPTPTNSQFVQTLMTEGRATVVPDGNLEADTEFPATLSRWAAEAAAELAGDPPAFSPTVAGWAAEWFHQACRLVVCRDLGPETIESLLSRPCPEPRHPSTDWSADLLFRHLPDVLRLARHLSTGDPLVERLRALALDWPLSSVGLTGLTAVRVDSFIAHPTLRQLYADRILATQDVTRLGDPRVDAAVRSALGAHPELSPQLSARLAPA